MGIWIVSAVLAAALIFLITEKLPVDLIGLGIIAALMITGILDPKEAVQGFSHPAVITVGALFLVSRAMVRTGSVGFIGERIIAYSRGDRKWAMLLILLIVAAASAFINNMPVVVLFIPILLSVSCKYEFSPSKLLIPISYASILAGTCTLIGTSTNIIVSDLSSMYGYGEIGMFELSRLGIPIAVLGIAFLYLAAPRTMPGHAPPVCELDGAHRRYLAEFELSEESALIGQDPLDVFKGKYPSIDVLEVIRRSRVLYPERDRIRLAPQDLLLVKGSPRDLVSVLHDRKLDLPRELSDMNFTKKAEDTVIVELIIPPQSSLLGQKLLDTPIHRDREIQIIAVRRRNILYSEQKIRNMTLGVGDILLVRCTVQRLKQMRPESDFILVEDVHHEIVHKRKAPLAFAIFLAMIITAAAGLADIMAAALAAVLLMITTGCLPLREAYRSMNAEVLILIAGTIALGVAMEKTGATGFYAEAFLGLFKGSGPTVVLGGILLLTSLCTHVISNNATAVLLVPVSISTALTLGVDPKPFIIAVCFGASACYATPIGYKTNLLVYGPGGYRFSDFLKLGIPLNLLVIVMGYLFIPMIWPL